MKKRFLYLLSSVLAVFASARAQPAAHAQQGFSIGYFNDKFGSHGMRAGYEGSIWQKHREEQGLATGFQHALLLKANMSFYKHKRHHVGVLVQVSFGYRYTSKAGLTLEPLQLGIGYMHSFLAGKTYQVEPSGGFQRVALAANSSLILPYIQVLGIGYDFRQKGILPLSFMLSLDPYIQHSVNTQRRLRLATPISMTYYFR